MYQLDVKTKLQKTGSFGNLSQQFFSHQASKYVKIGTCPASQKNIGIQGKKITFSISIKFSLALQPEPLVNTSGRVLFSSLVMLGRFLG